MEPVEARQAPVPGRVVVDRERFGCRPDPAREPFALRDARSHALRERAGADGDTERVVLSQVDVGVACPDELSRLDGDPLEELLGVELVDEKESGLVERSELGMLTLELLLGG